jgi:hypothetical protein
MPIPTGGKPRWIEARDNPFGIRVFDCRPFTRTATATSRDLNIAQQFAASRSDNGSSRRHQLPAEAVTVECELRYAKSVPFIDGPFYRARNMEEKWDIDYFDNRMYFSRSWSGLLALVANVKQQPVGFEILSIFTVPVPSLETVPSDVDFLIKTYLFHAEAPHRVSQEIPDEEMAIVTYSFSKFGRDASFATYSDTTRIKL